MDDFDAERMETAVKRAKSLVWLLSIALACGFALVIIDSGIKKAVLIEAEKARGLLASVQSLTKEAGSYERAEAAGSPGSPASPTLDGGNGVVRDAAAGKAVAEAVRAPATPRANGTRRVQSRAPRDG